MDFNFLFSQGPSLVESIIDPSKVYKVVDKIKDLANSRDSSKDIVYEELIEQLKNETADTHLDEPKKTVLDEQ